MSNANKLFVTMSYKKSGDLEDLGLIESKLAKIVGRKPVRVETVPGTGALNRRIEWHFETEEQCRNASRWLVKLMSLCPTAVVSVEKPELPC